MKAVIDRFEGDFAVLILGDEESLAEAASSRPRLLECHEVLNRLNLPRTQLPPKAKEGSWLTLDIVGGEPRNLTLDEKETAATRKRIAEKLARLRKGR